MEEDSTEHQNEFGTLQIETDHDKADEMMLIEKHRFLYKNEPISKLWIIYHVVIILCSVALLIPCFVVPLTGAFFVYVGMLLFISIDALITIFSCKNGVCCKSKNIKINIFDDILMIITTMLWILALFISIICGISDTSSPYTTWNRWEEFIPIIYAIFIIITLCVKLRIRISTNTLPFVYNTNYNNYNSNISSNSSMFIYYLLPFKWIFLIFFIILSFILTIHSIQKSLFINTFDQRNTHILTTRNYGKFEYQCLGTVQPENANIRIISIGGLSTIHLSFGWYNNLIYNEYGINNNLNITICDYNRGGYGFTETKKYGDKSIKSEVHHLMEIADILFGKNNTFHLMGHSRAGVILLMTKMLHNNRISSMIIFDGVSNANKIKYTSTDYEDRVWASDSIGYQLWYQLYSVGLPLLTDQMTTSVVIGLSGASDKNNMYEPDLSGKYYSMRNYLYQSVIWESRDMSNGWRNTMKLYNQQNLNFTLGPTLNVECDEEYNKEIEYSSINQTLYVKTSHQACVLDKDIADLVFYYNDNGVKAFYDTLFL